MNKQLIVAGLAISLIIVALSGCIEKIKDETEGETETETSHTFNNVAYRQYGFGLNPPGESQINKTTTIWKTNWTMNESEYGVSFTLQDENSVTFSVYRNYLIVKASGRITEEDGKIVVPKNKYEYEIKFIFNEKPFNEYAEESIESYMSNFDNASFVSKGITTTINGMNAYVAVYSFEINIGNETKRYVQKYVLIEKNGVIFNLMFTASEDLYNKYITEVDQSINSFVMQ